MAKIRINQRYLLTNDPLPWDVFDENGARVLHMGSVITRESQREVLAARGLYVEETHLRAFRPENVARPALESRAYDEPFRLWECVIDELEILLRDVRNTPDFRSQIEGIASLIQQQARSNPETALAAAILTNQQRYPVIHSVHVAMLVELVAARLAWMPDRRIGLVCAALTQNLAMIDLQTQLCNQRVAPSAEQREEILRHPKLGHDMLQLVGVTDPCWLKAVLEHHENTGGGGYPFGITTPSEEALLIQTADIFAAKVSPRAARKPITPQAAAKALYLDSGGGEKNPYVAVLIKEIGIFPPGTFVRLANGETALVVRRGVNANTPEVLSLVKPSGMVFQKPMPRQTERPGMEIVAVIPRDQLKVDININRIWAS